MKVIFLDIDGVLNSKKYDRTRGPEDGNIDNTRLELLRKIVVETGAEIVLSSTWRKNWNQDDEKCKEKARGINELFARYGLKIIDTTPHISKNDADRPREIAMWLDHHRSVTSFVVLDDHKWGWAEHGLDGMLVQTSFWIGYGLEDKHVRRAIEILNN